MIDALGKHILEVLTEADSDDLPRELRKAREQSIIDSINREIDDELLGSSAVDEFCDIDSEPLSKKAPKPKKKRPSGPQTLTDVWEGEENLHKTKRNFETNGGKK